MNSITTPSNDVTGPRSKQVMKVWIDFVCPFCLLAESLIQKAIEGVDVDIQWMPFELREYPTPTLRPEDEYLPKIWRRSVYPMAESLGAPIKLPTISPQPYSRLAFVGFQFVQEQGNANQYVDAVFKAFFQKDLNIGDVGVLLTIAQEVGLSGTDFAAALQSKKYGALHDAALKIAREQVIRAVPTVQVGNDRFDGMPNLELLRKCVVAVSRP